MSDFDTKLHPAAAASAAFVSQAPFPHFSLQTSSNRQAGGESQVPGAIYLRLSKDDEGAGESISIANQRKLLLRYAKEHSFTIIREYVDDGFSGTSFDRPGFQRLIEDIRNKEIHLVLTKDLSRLGRDYIKTGEYTEHFFPAHKVRFIAVGDGYDSDNSSSDLIPFRNVINEMYARDISRKIRASLHVRMEEGSYIGNFAPYGYQKNSGERRSLSPDPEAAPVVLRLFQEAAAGSLPSEIAHRLNKENVPCPSRYRQSHFPQLESDPRYKNKLWTANTVIKILHNPVYLGHMVQGKTRKLSFKSSSSLPVPASERICVPDTHPAIVTEELFYRCQEQLASRICRRQKRP